MPHPKSLFFAVAAIAAPAMAQDHGHHHTAPPATKPATDPHAGHGAKAAPKPSAAKADPHAGHAMPATDPHAGHTMPPPPAADPHAGHGQKPAAPDPHAGHSAASAPAGTDLPAGNAPPPPVPAERAADAVYGTQAMHMGRHHLDQFHGAQKFGQLMINLAEARIQKGRNGFGWDAEGWYGGDIHRLWIKSEGEGDGSGIEEAEVQALLSRAVGPYFNVQGGMRVDVGPRPRRVYATIGFEGLAPSFFDVEGALFLSSKGELLARVEGHYDQRITQRLILQPRAEVNLSAQSRRDMHLGAGLSDGEVGLRLRYDIRREFAPYVGVQYSRAFGKTRDFLREAGERAGAWSLVTGLRVWF